MLVLIILVYACCHSIRETSTLFTFFGVEKLFKWSNNTSRNAKTHISYILTKSVDEGLSSRTYFSVKELLASAGGEEEEEPGKLRTEVFFVSGTAETEFSPRMMIATSVSHLLITVNSSINFAIYCIKVRSEALRWHYYIVIMFYYRSKHSVKATILGIH